MEIVSSGTELIKAITDIPIALMCIPFAVCSRKGDWRKMFAFLAAAAAGGCIAHGLEMGELALRLLWVFLYGFMTAATYYAYRGFMHAARREVTEVQNRILFLLGSIIGTACAGVRLVAGRNMILLYIVYPAVFAIQYAVTVLRADRENMSVKLMKMAFAILFIGLLCQGAVVVLPGFNGAAAAHVAIIAALAVIFKVSRMDSETI